LIEEAQLATGDAIFCSGCKAAFSAISKLSPGTDGVQVWNCEFCKTKNDVLIEEEEVILMCRVFINIQDPKN
jgi:hypothetical protein